MNKKGSETAWGIAIAIIVVVIVVIAFWGIPKYRVYSQELSGKADLKEAEWNRQIAIEEAQAEKASASLKAEADVIRAIGIAEANDIIAQSLTEEYIRWKWVEGLQDSNSEVIYIATEAGLPIMEANRLRE